MEHGCLALLPGRQEHLVHSSTGKQKGNRKGPESQIPFKNMPPVTRPSSTRPHWPATPLCRGQAFDIWAGHGYPNQSNYLGIKSHLTKPAQRQEGLLKPQTADPCQGDKHPRRMVVSHSSLPNVHACLLAMVFSPLESLVFSGRFLL